MKRPREGATSVEPENEDVEPSLKRVRTQELGRGAEDAPPSLDNEEGTRTKRKRGRPRKGEGNPKRAPEVSNGIHPVDGMEVEGSSTRKSERPRKSTARAKGALELAREPQPDNDAGGTTPSKRKRGRRPKSDQKPSTGPEATEEARSLNGIESATPTKRKRGRPPGSKNKPRNVANGVEELQDEELPDPRAKAKTLFATPQKQRGGPSEENTPVLVRNADPSARRQSAKMLIERTVAGDLSDEGELDEEDTLAQRIWDENVDENAEALPEPDQEVAESSAQQTPSKRGRGRPKGSRRKRSPTPPQDLPFHEQYFFQNRPGGVKTSNNTLSGVSLLTHDEYFSLIRNYIDSHDSERAYLEELHSRSFDQWNFELNEGFNVCLYGYGSKRHLVNSFAQYLYSASPLTGKIVIVNGHLTTFTIRDVLHTIGDAMLSPAELATLSGSQPSDLLASLLTLISATNPTPQLTLLIHSIDSPLLRRPTTQSLLARLAAHPSIRLVATASHPSFPLLWDSSLRTAYNFVFHDCTTFRPPDASELDVVSSVHELLGRSGRRVGGKEGVAFVLKSLPENARALYRILVAEQLAGMLEQEEGNEDLDTAQIGRDTTASAATVGVEFRVLYQKATEEFICGSEMAFRTLLKEFHDHQMISSRRDMLGGTGVGEILCVPFSKEELESILEELMD